MLQRSLPLFSAALGFHVMLGPSAAIVMDGRFDDPSSGLTAFTVNKAPATGIDLLSAQVTNDDQHRYIELNIGSEIDLLDDLVP